MRIQRLFRCAICFIVSMILILATLYVSTVPAQGYSAPIQNREEDYDRYLEIIEELDLPESFVHYKHIRALGTFSAFIWPNGNIDEIRYELVDENGYSLVLLILFRTRADNINRLDMSLCDKNMRTLKEAKSGQVARGPLQYVYNNGKLVTVYWNLGETAIVLTGNGHEGAFWSEYPMNGKETICNQLLSSNYLVALSAYYELIEDIPLQPGETKWNRMKYKVFAFAEGTVVVTAVAAPCIWLWLRHKKKRNAATMPPESPESTPSTI